MATPFNVCGGMQDNYDWCGPSAVRGAAGIANHHWTTIQGGDGFVVLQDPADNRVIYSESQDGNIVRVDRVTGETMGIRPQAAQGEPPLRWHWDTPIIISPHDPKVVFTAAQKVFRSADRGLSWTAISGDLTSDVNRDEIVTMGVKGSEITISKNDGIVAWPTIVSIAESPKRAGLIYAGTDDGNLQVSRDAGKSWTSLYAKLPAAPKGAFVSEVVPSRFDEGTVYATIDDHRQGNFETYVYVEPRFRADVAIGEGKPERRGREDADGRPEEPGRAVRRDRDRTVRQHGSRKELGASARESPNGSYRRDHAAPARQRACFSRRTDARCGSSTISSPFRSTRPRSPPRPTRSCSRRRRRRCIAGPSAIATTSSGGTRRSSARTRRRPP